MGTYIGNENGTFLFLSREPLAVLPAEKANIWLRFQASHFLIDTSAKSLWFAAVARPRSRIWRLSSYGG